MTLVSRIKEVAQKQDMSVIDVALKAGIAENSIYGWTQKTPKSDTLSKVADVLHVSTDYLLGRTEDPFVVNNKDNLINIDDASLLIAFDGKVVDEDDKQAMINALRYHRYMKSLEDN